MRAAWLLSLQFSKKSKVPPASGPTLPLAFYFILMCSEEMKADHFHTPPPCSQWDHPPHVTGEHVLHRQHPGVLLLSEHTGVQSTLLGTNPHAQETPGQPLHNLGSLLTGGGCPLLAGAGCPRASSSTYTPGR